MLPRSLLCLLSVLALAACTGSTDDGASGSEDDLHTKPKGPDASPGSVVVKSPAAAAKLLASKYGVNHGGDSTPLDTPVSNLKIGTTPLEVSSGTSTSLWALTQGNVTVTNGKRVEVTTAALHVSRRAGVFGLTSYGPINAGGSSLSGDMRTSVSWSEAVDKTPEAVAVMPGDYQFIWGWGDGYLATAGADAITEIGLGVDYTQRRVARLVAPASRDLPDACREGNAREYRVSYGVRGRSPSDYRAVSLNDGQSIEIGRNPKIFPGEIVLTIAVACVPASFEIPLGDLGAGPRDFTMGRLDVDDVTVTEDDGSTRMAKGTWTVLDPSTKLHVIPGFYATGTGIDLPPGSYLLDVRYTKSDGTEGVYQENVTF